MRNEHTEYTVFRPRTLSYTLIHRLHLHAESGFREGIFLEIFAAIVSNMCVCMCVTRFDLTDSPLNIGLVDSAEDFNI